VKAERATEMLQVILSGNLPTALANRRRGSRQRILHRRPMRSRETWSARRINRLHDAFPRLRRYLEVGVESGRTLENVTLPERVAVEPRPRFDVDHLPAGVRVHVQTSDEFFASDPGAFDIVFLDGLHTYEQTYRDVVNTFTASPTAIVLVDDVVPCDEASAIPDQDRSLAERQRRGLPGRFWHGDVFRMVPCLAKHHPELAFRTITDRDNPQMLAWKPNPSSPTVAVDRIVLTGYGDLGFAHVFGAGVPAVFAPTSEEAALRDAVAAVRRRGRAGR
jgi:hypothetical protein